MIRIAYEGNRHRTVGGLYLPLVVCDVCGAPIRGDGGAWWVDPIDEPIREVFHAHKRECAWTLYLRLTRDAGGSGLVCDEDLDDWLAHVLHNARARRRRARARPKRARKEQGTMIEEGESPC